MDFYLTTSVNVQLKAEIWEFCPLMSMANAFSIESMSHSYVYFQHLAECLDQNLMLTYIYWIVKTEQDSLTTIPHRPTSSTKG